MYKKPMRPLPPLNALRAFEAAARHLSFRRAAEELHVTPAAISHQIKGLEEFLGINLFRRLPRAVILTEEAQMVLPLVTEAFERLSDAVSLLSDAETSGTLTVSVAPTFAERWLVRRLAQFSEHYPDIDVRVDATNQVRDFERDDIDIAVRHGPGDYPGLRVERLFGHHMIPVCHPRLLDGPYPLRKPSDLQHHTLLHVDWGHLALRADWPMWLASMGVKNVDTTRGMVFTVESMAIAAAVQGDGVALAAVYAVEREMNDGLLVAPFPQSMCSNLGFWLVEPARRATRPKVEAFRRWILEQTQALRNGDGG